MAIKPETETPSQSYKSFDVTCVVGTVEIDEFGTLSPHVAAFMLIAEHDAPGTYKFPGRAGGECSVTVTYDGQYA